MEKKKVLALGMVYAEADTEPGRGQQFRDRTRISALEDLDYTVYSLDNKHDPEYNFSARHCQANFAGSP